MMATRLCFSFVVCMKADGASRTISLFSFLIFIRSRFDPTTFSFLSAQQVDAVVACVHRLIASPWTFVIRHWPFRIRLISTAAMAVRLAEEV